MKFPTKHLVSIFAVVSALAVLICIFACRLVASGSENSAAVAFSASQTGLNKADKPSDTKRVIRVIREPQTKEVVYNVTRPVRENQSKTVKFDVTRIVREQRTKIDPITGAEMTFTVASPITEQHEKVVNFVVTKWVTKQKKKTVEYSTTRYETTELPN